MSIARSASSRRQASYESATILNDLHGTLLWQTDPPRIEITGQCVSAPSNRELEHALYEGGSLVALSRWPRTLSAQRSTTIRFLGVRGEGNALSQRQACTEPSQFPKAPANGSSGNYQTVPTRTNSRRSNSPRGTTGLGQLATSSARSERSHSRRNFAVRPNRRNEQGAPFRDFHNNSDKVALRTHRGRPAKLWILFPA